MRILLAFYCILFFSKISIAQKKINFYNKKISDLNVSMGEMHGFEEFRPTFPLIWKNYYATSGDYIFTGYYSIDPKTGNDNKILNGEVRLIRIQIQVAEGTLNIKEELTFNFNNGNMNGPISYIKYTSENNGETNEAHLKNVKWEKGITITSSYSYSEGAYKNISYSETRDWEKTKYSILQGSGYDISLDYFSTIIDINTSAPNERPIFKKLKY